MKKIFLLFTLALSMIIMQSNNALAKEKKNETTLTFMVDMDCHSCVQKIEGNIPYEKGVKDLKVSLDNKECVLTFRTDQTDTDKLVKAFKKLGYTATIKTDEKDTEQMQQNDHEGHMQNMEH